MKEGEQKLERDCLQTIEEVYASRPDLKDPPLSNPDLELYTDGSSFVTNGRRVCAVTAITEVMEANALSSKASVQKAELMALTRALDLSKGKRVNIWTDSKYAFGVIHAHGSIWKERGLLTTPGTTIKHEEETLKLLGGVQAPAKVAAMYCKAHRSGSNDQHQGNTLADWAAKRAAEKGIQAEAFAITPERKIILPEKMVYGKQDLK